MSALKDSSSLDWSLATVAEVSAQSDASLADGEVCFCETVGASTNVYFRLNRESTAVVDNETILATASGAGRWERMGFGRVGPQGPRGPQGEAGPQGPAGFNGAASTTSVTGPTGPRGIQGIEGPPGPVGPSGPQGVAGLAGPTGPEGPPGAGYDGPMGIAGPQGYSQPLTLTALSRKADNLNIPVNRVYELVSMVVGGQEGNLMNLEVFAEFTMAFLGSIQVLSMAISVADEPTGTNYQQTNWVDSSNVRNPDGGLLRKVQTIGVLPRLNTGHVRVKLLLLISGAGESGGTVPWLPVVPRSAEVLQNTYGYAFAKFTARHIPCTLNQTN